jgi:NAD(P)H-nitrite reductase large subunit
VYRVKLTS